MRKKSAVQNVGREGKGRLQEERGCLFSRVGYEGETEKAAVPPGCRAASERARSAQWSGCEGESFR